MSFAKKTVGIFGILRIHCRECSLLLPFLAARLQIDGKMVFGTSDGLT